MGHISKGIFITGTDTGVGKTRLATGIAAELRRRGVDVGVMKPAETGCSTRSGRLIPRDALRLMDAAHVKDSLDLVNPYRFKNPLAPSIAAGLEGKKIEPKKIIASFQKLSRRHDFMIVEGAGGILVPLWHGYTYLDLAGALGLSVLVVARPGLGTINHTLLTIMAFKSRNIGINGVVINHAGRQKTGLAEKTSPTVIEQISGIAVCGILPFGSRDFAGIVERCI